MKPKSTTAFHDERVGWLLWVVIGVGFSVMIACGGEERSIRESTPEAVEEDRPREAPSREMRAGGPEGAEDLSDCVNRVNASTPPELRDGLEDLGQSDLASSLCQSAAAVRAGEVEDCEALGLSALRRGCLHRLAILHQRPEACPSDRVLPGREPRCLAWASGKPLLCQALASDAARVCHAVLSSEEEPCAEVVEEDQAACQDMRERYAHVAGRGEGELTTMPSLLEVSWTRTRGGLAQGEGRERFMFGRWGVAVERESDVFRLKLSDPMSAPEQVGLRAIRNRALELSLSLPVEHTLPTRGQWSAESQVRFWGRPDVRFDDEGEIEGHVDWAEFTPERGSRVLLHFRLRRTLGDEEIEIYGRLRSFVRDIQARPDEEVGRD